MTLYDAASNVWVAVHAGDIPGQPVIWYTLRGTYATGSMAVHLRKVYERPVGEGMEVAGAFGHDVSTFRGYNV